MAKNEKNKKHRVGRVKKLHTSAASLKPAISTKASRLSRVKLSKSHLLFFSLVFAIIGGYAILKSFAASTATVTVTNTTGANIQTQLSTNIVPYYPLNTVTGAQAKFNALHPPYVRLHIGDDSTAMPEERQNQWANQGESRAFESLDELVSEVFQANQQPLMNIKFA